MYIAHNYYTYHLCFDCLSIQHYCANFLNAKQNSSIDTVSVIDNNWKMKLTLSEITATAV